MQKKRVIVHKIACGVTIAVSIILSITMLVTADTNLTTGEPINIRTDAFSVIGFANREMFFIWGVATGLAVFLNLRLLAVRLGLVHRWFTALLAFGCSMTLVTVSVMGYDSIARPIHVGSAALFGFCTAISLIIILVKKLKKNKRITSMYLTIFAMTAVIFVFTTIYVGWLTALTQILLTNISLVIMFASNFMEKWPAEISEEQQCVTCEPVQ
ncbi:MAG: hypothetical protein FWE38_02290 [Firmicutes bacterium]|nr:hypothetical protein [Bacillota bacterium]